MIQGDIHFFVEKDYPNEYNITSLFLRCLSPYVTEIRHLLNTLKLRVNKWKIKTNHVITRWLTASCPIHAAKENNLIKNHQVVILGGPDGIRTRDSRGCLTFCLNEH